LTDDTVNPGSYSLGATGSCVTCTSFDDCPRDIDVPCQNGTYFNPEAGGCHNCPDGYYCSNGKDPEKCPVDTFALGGFESCLYCDEGYYPNADQSGCLICPAGYACDPGVSMVKCISGFYSMDGERSCEQCPGGHQCKNVTFPDPCDDGYFAPPGLAECMIVPEGYMSPNRETISPCSPRTFSPAGVSDCYDESEHSNRLRRDAADCASAGEFYSSTRDTCLPCPSGSKCTAGVAEECATGEYSDMGQSDCQSCGDLTNTVCATSSKKIEDLESCAPGRTRRSNGVGTQQCSSGNYCPGDCGEYDCDDGLFATNGQSTCQLSCENDVSRIR